MFLIKFLAKIILFFGRVKNKIVSLYQLSQIPHGKGCVIRGGDSAFFGNITFGDYVTTGVNVLFMSSDAKLTIGNHVGIAARTCIMTGNHQVNCIGKYFLDVTEKTEKCDEDVTIEDDVWIGTGSIILKGVTIGRGSVIGAGSVVTKSTKPYSINAGNPCRFIKMRFTDEEIKRHEEILGYKEKTL